MKLQDLKNQMDQMFGDRHINIKSKNRFGKVGKRTAKQIGEEIEHLRKADKRTAERVRASYTISK